MQAFDWNKRDGIQNDDFIPARVKLTQSRQWCAMILCVENGLMVRQVHVVCVVNILNSKDGKAIEVNVSRFIILYYSSHKLHYTN